MKITEISVAKKNKTRSNLYVDGEFFASVDNLTAVKYGLKTGLEIENDRLLQIIHESECEKALSYAYGYLSKYRKTEKGLRDKLKERGYIQSIIDYVIQKTSEYKYVDDQSYSQSYIECNKRNKGARLLKFELKNKGVPDEVIDNMTFNQEDEENACKELCRKFFLKNDNTRENVNKLVRRLTAKGFSYDCIKQSISISVQDIELDD